MRAREATHAASTTVRRRKAKAKDKEKVKEREAKEEVKAKETVHPDQHLNT